MYCPKLKKFAEIKLGLFFFIVHINDYPQCLKHTAVTKYEDDTSQSTVGESSEIFDK